MVIYLLARLTPEDNEGVVGPPRLCSLIQKPGQGMQKATQDVQCLAGCGRGKCQEGLPRAAANLHRGLAKSGHAGRWPSSAWGCGGVREGGEGPRAEPLRPPFWFCY